MARTVIPVTKALPYLVGNNPTATAGDAANDHEAAMLYGPIVLIAVNSNAATVDFTIACKAGPHSFNKYITVSNTVPAAAAGVSGVRAFWIDFPASAYTTPATGTVETIRIDSADANFGDVNFYAVAATTTPR